MGMFICADGVARELPHEPPPVLPEFSFSPRVVRPVAPRPTIRQAPAIDAPPASMWGRDWRKPQPNEVRPSEQEWRQGRLVWDTKPVKAHEKPPIGTVPPFDDELRAADADLKFILDTQCCSYHAEGGNNFEHSGRVLDLPTVGQELSTLGLPSVNLTKSSSQDDDDMTPLEALIADDQAADRFGIAYGMTIHNPGPAIRKLAGLDPTVEVKSVTLTGQQMQALIQRIEWEKTAFACGPVQKYWLIAHDGTIKPATNEQTFPEGIVKRLATIAGLLDGRPIEEFEADRWFATKFHKAIGSFAYGVLKGQHPIVSRVVDESTTPDEQNLIGPRELGLDEIDPLELLTESEPPEGVLWPVQPEEVVWNLQHGITLSAIETRWLYHPAQDALLRTLRGAGYAV